MWTLEDEEPTQEEKKKTIEEQIVFTEQLIMDHEAAHMFQVDLERSSPSVLQPH